MSRSTVLPASQLQSITMGTSRRSFPTKLKQLAVRRFLQGESASEVSLALNVPVDAILRWRDEIAAADKLSGYRALVPEYVDLISSRKSWPEQAFAKQWLSEFCGCSSDEYSAVCTGRLAPQKYALGFVMLLIRNSRNSAVLRCFERTAEFLTARGMTALDEDHAEAAVAHLFTAVVPERKNHRPIRDGLGGMFHTLLGRLHGEFDERLVRGCRPEHIETVIAWMYTRLGQCTQAEGPLLHPAAAAAAGERVIRLPKAKYADRARLWAASFPWSVVRAWHGGRAHGMSIVLPLTAAAYDAVRRGSKWPHECSAQDMQVPTTHIVLEAAAERPDDSTTTVRVDEVTWSMLVCFAYQLGAQVRAQRFSSPTPLRLLSFAATAKNRARLIKGGFVPIDSKLPGTQIQLMEKVVEIGTSRMLLNPDLIVLAAASVAAPDHPRMDDG